LPNAATAWQQLFCYIHTSMVQGHATRKLLTLSVLTVHLMVGLWFVASLTTTPAGLGNMADDADGVRHLHCIHPYGSTELVWNLPAASIAGRDAGGGFQTRPQILIITDSPQAAEPTKTSTRETKIRIRRLGCFSSSCKVGIPDKWINACSCPAQIRFSGYTPTCSRCLLVARAF
jgi:hypothetical protein